MNINNSTSSTQHTPGLRRFDFNADGSSEETPHGEFVRWSDIAVRFNAHDGLVEALRKTRAFLSVSSFHDDEDALALLADVDAAIAKATGSAS